MNSHKIKCLILCRKQLGPGQHGGHSNTGLDSTPAASCGLSVLPDSKPAAAVTECVSLSWICPGYVSPFAL